MAAINAPSVNDSTYNGQRVLDGCKRLVFGIGCGASTADTWASGIAGIQAVAWIPTSDTDQCAPTFSGSTVTFNIPSAAATTGILVVYAKG